MPISEFPGRDDVMTYAESARFYEQAARDQHLTPRQVRNQGMDPLPTWETILSVEQNQAIAEATAASLANAQDPLLNGQDAMRRLHSHELGMG
jgi:hypothetical protein